MNRSEYSEGKACKVIFLEFRIFGTLNSCRVSKSLCKPTMTKCF